jgi:hypothetical protein
LVNVIPETKVRLFTKLLGKLEQVPVKPVKFKLRQPVPLLLVNKTISDPADILNVGRLVKVPTFNEDVMVLVPVLPE